MMKRSLIELHHADCFEVMGEIPNESVDAVICDPPFGTTLMKWDEVLDSRAMWWNYARILKPNGVVVLFGSQPFTSALVMSNPEWFRHELIWDKNKCGSPGLANIRPMKVHEDVAVFSPVEDFTWNDEEHENVLVFSGKRHVYNPQMEAGEPYARKSSKPEGYVGKANNHQYGLKARTEFKNEGTRYPKSILRIPRDFSAQQQVHPTQKPVPLMEWLVKTYTNPGDIVLDNCMGSGSTGVACVNTGRRFIGIEKELNHYNVAVRRITDAQKQQQ